MNATTTATEYDAYYDEYDRNDYSRPATYRTADGKRTAELDYKRNTLTVFEGPRTLVTLDLDDAKTITNGEVWKLIAAAEAPAEKVAEEPAAEAPAATETHVCDEEAERKAYRQYISDGLADTDGWYHPESFEAWQAHYHRSIGYQEPRTKECTATECHAPQHERVRLVQRSRYQVKKLGMKRFLSLCTPCFQPHLAAELAEREARNAPRR